MFTGIVDHCANIAKIEKQAQTMKLWIQHTFDQPLVLGESISVEGICLTVTGILKNTFSCDISPETYQVTTAKIFKIGTGVNLERALLLSSRLGGHIVMGHVDQLCKISQRRETKEYVEFELQGLTPATQQFVLQKGSITINGVSLTINSVTPEGFTVMLIPHTLQITSLGQLAVQDEVNIEFDMMTKVFVDQCQRYFTQRPNEVAEKYS